jgi:hypothetical protein
MPDLAEAHAGLGNALGDRNRLDEALSCQRRALALQPDSAEAHHNLGTSLADLGRLDEAVECYRRAIELRPDFADAHYNLSIALLLDGEFPRGWDEGEWRWRRRDKTQEKLRSFAQPLWSGEQQAPRTILVWCEQGLGDSIHFVRYVPELVKRGWRVILEAPTGLRRLFATVEGVTLVERGDPLPHFDTHCPLLSLPRAFGTTLATIPAAVPYLGAGAEGVATWRDRLGDDGSRPRVGLAWAGNPAFIRDAARSPRLDVMMPLLEVPGIRFFGLQMGDGRRDLSGRAMPPGFTDLGPEITDFADTAAILANLDLIVTSDTAVAHLAGALGRPVWVALKAVPDWRWLRERDDSPWYPSMRLFRQPRPGDWRPVVEALGRELAVFARR